MTTLPVVTITLRAGIITTLPVVTITLRMGIITTLLVVTIITLLAATTVIILAGINLETIQAVVQMAIRVPTVTRSKVPPGRHPS